MKVFEEVASGFAIRVTGLLDGHLFSVAGGVGFALVSGAGSVTKFLLPLYLSSSAWLATRLNDASTSSGDDGGNLVCFSQEVLRTLVTIYCDKKL